MLCDAFKEAISLFNEGRRRFDDERFIFGSDGMGNSSFVKFKIVEFGHLKEFRNKIAMRNV